MRDTDTRWTRKHLLGLEELSADEIRFVLDTADSFKEVSTRSIKKVPALRGRVVVNAFFEDSHAHAHQLRAGRPAAQRRHHRLLRKRLSSVSKGETLIDTARNIEAMGIDMMVDPPHRRRRGAQLLSQHDASAASSTPATARTSTRRRACSISTRSASASAEIEGLKVAIVGDIANSRVARSNLWALTKLGAEVILVGPPTLLPKSVRAARRTRGPRFRSSHRRSGRDQHAPRAVRAHEEQPVSQRPRVHAACSA